MIDTLRAYISGLFSAASDCLMSDCLFPYWLIYNGFQALQLIVLAMFVTLDQPVASFMLVRFLK